SAGAFNATLLLSHSDLEFSDAVGHLEDVWLHDVADSHEKGGNGVLRYRGNPLDFIDPSRIMRHPAEPAVRLVQDTSYFAQDWLRRGFNFLSSSGSLEQRALELIDLGAFTSTAPFVDLVRKTVSLNAVRSAATDLRIPATNWRTGEIRIFEKKDLTDDVG